jgi:hypothetical protein
VEGIILRGMQIRSAFSTLLSRPFFFLLLPVFFVVHGWVENFFIINLPDILRLFLYYIGAVILFFGIFKFLYKNNSKAALATFLTFIIYFFFGAIHDFVKQHVSALFSKYSFLLSFLLLVYLLLLYWLRTRRPGKKFLVYLNVLLVILISVDLVVIVQKINRKKSSELIIASKPGMAKPNVYLLVLDEYAGIEQLRHSFHFSDQSFLDSLSTRGFTINRNATCNYSSTPFSMASLLSMSFHDELKKFDYTTENMKYCYKKILQSSVVSGFKSLGYRFYNYSIFDFEGESKLISGSFLKSGPELITSQTLWSRVKKDLYYNFILQNMRKSSLYTDYMMKDYYNNDLLYRITMQQAGLPSLQPKFVYTHLLMPHFPYYFNAKGNMNSWDQIAPENMTNKTLYLGYLQYVNGKVLSLLNAITTADKNAIILLLSDHGYRYAGDGDYVFSNLMAVYNSKKTVNSNLPETNVNVFRSLFNDLFKTQLPLLPDKHFR